MREKKKSDGLDKSRVSAHGHLCHLIIELVGPERKHSSPTKFFPSPPSIQTLTKNIFLPIFFSEVFHSPYFTSKQTHFKRVETSKIHCDTWFSKIIILIIIKEIYFLGVTYTLRILLFTPKDF